MNILLDVIIVLLILIPILVSTKRGFIKSITKITALVAAIIVAVSATPYVCELADGAGYRAMFEEKLTGTIAGMTESDEDAANDIEDKDSELYKFLGGLGVDVNSLKQSISQSAGDTISNIAQSTAALLAEKLIYFICFVILFFASYIVALILLWLISKIAKLPVIKHCDKALGFIIGVVYAVVLTVVFIGIFDAVLPLISSAYPTVFESDLADKTCIYKFVASFLTDVKNLLF